MTAPTRVPAAPPLPLPRRLLRIAWLASALAALVAARAAALGGEGTGAAPTVAFAAGTAFGLAALAIAALDGWRPGWPGLPTLAIGFAAGLVLVAIPVLSAPGAGIGSRPQPFLAWALVTGLVASGEEVLLRGALLKATEELAGLPAAIAVTSLAFALLHIPLYGWSVLPLDVAAGVWLAGVRLSAGLGAAVVAHAVADLATWWL